MSHSPPSPPFHYVNAPGILWNGSGAFIRGEYLFQDGNNVLADPYGYYGYPAANGQVANVQGSDIRPNGIFKESEIVDLPAPPRYKSSLVM
uniref:Uncharacterized protein n=1 Tax=Panagrolaimus sp. JU765 TaxID=591449 RepID=A0AC34QSE8_9BILA